MLRESLSSFETMMPWYFPALRAASIAWIFGRVLMLAALAANSSAISKLWPMRSASRSSSPRCTSGVMSCLSVDTLM